MQAYRKYKIITKGGWIIILVLIITLSISCKKFVQVGPPDTQVSSIKVFADDNSATTAAISVYGQMGASYFDLTSGGMTIYPALTADELNTTTSNSELLSFQNNNIIPNNGFGIYTHLWKAGYLTIYFANDILEGLTSSTTITESLRNQLIGEMLVIRAFNYFNLVNLFGDVPLELSSDYRLNSIMPRTPVSDVYKQLVNDLLKAEELLQENYPSEMKARVNKWTAAALLARIYLYQADWANAEAQTSMVIDSNAYGLEPDLDKVFSMASNETIWQLANDISNTVEAQTFIPYSTTNLPDYVLTPFLKSAFEPGDQRLTTWTGFNLVDTTVYYYPKKYRDNNYEPVTEFYIVLRLGEQYLIRAEARAQTDKINEALEDLNMIRYRAGLLPYSGSDKEEVLLAIEHERQVELFCEWGHRWCDLKRTGKADEVLGMEKAPDWQADDALYPIPAIELMNNPFLVQNPGY